MRSLECAPEPKVSARGALNGVLVKNAKPLNPRNLRTRILRPLGPKTILFKAFGLLDIGSGLLRDGFLSQAEQHSLAGEAAQQGQHFCMMYLYMQRFTVT